MSTETLPREQVDTGQRTGDVAHYIDQRADKSIADDAYLFGQELTALCGEKFVPTKNPYGLPICEACKQVKERLTGGGA